MSETRVAARILKGFALLAILGVVAVGMLLAALWLEHRTEVTLPTPTGPLAVGRAIYDWTDDATLDTLAPVPGRRAKKTGSSAILVQLSQIEIDHHS